MSHKLPYGSLLAFVLWIWYTISFAHPLICFHFTYVLIHDDFANDESIIRRVHAFRYISPRNTGFVQQGDRSNHRCAHHWSPRCRPDPGVLQRGSSGDNRA